MMRSSQRAHGNRMLQVLPSNAETMQQVFQAKISLL